MTSENSLVGVDAEIFSCLNLDEPKSFFLFAGAGSGKTGSLVRVLQTFREQNISRLRLNGQKVAVITYTNAACDEIQRRLEFDSAFVVSTIHSFCWELIRPYQADLKEWVEKETKDRIDELRVAQAKGRAGTKAAIDRDRKIESKNKRLEVLDKIRAFTYSPNGVNSSRDSLSHEEVIKIASEFLIEKPLMRKILVRKYPILLVDESQDTREGFIEALFDIQGRFVRTLLNNHHEAGYHSLSVDFSDLPSGLYLYRLKAESHTQFRRLVYLK